MIMVMKIYSYLLILFGVCIIAVNGIYDVTHNVKALDLNINGHAADTSYNIHDSGLIDIYTSNYDIAGKLTDIWAMVTPEEDQNIKGMTLEHCEL